MRRGFYSCFGLIAAIAAVGAAYWFGDTAVRAGIARSIESRLPETIGPARQYSVGVYGGLVDILRGRASRVTVIGDGVELRCGLTLNRLTADLRGVRISSTRDRITGVDSARFAASVAQQQLNDYFASRFVDIPGCGIKLGQGRATLCAKPEIAGLKLRVEADGALRLANQYRIVFDIADIRLRGLSIPTPEFAREYLEDRINPILDTSEWGLGLALDSVKTTPDAVTLVGSARFRDLRRL